ncbi:MAG: hypothetical protein WB586_11075 [Chthoniobacterales bacterium]
MPNAFHKRRTAINLLGIVVLVLGIASANIVYWREEDRSPKQKENQGASNVENGWKDSTLSPDDSKGSSRDIEMLYGKLGALLISSWHRCEELLSGPKSGATVIGVISAVLAFTCFVAANRPRR